MDNQRRYQEIMDMTLLGTNPNVLMEYIAALVRDAYIAGYHGSKGIGLNLSVTERADDYLKDKGLKI